MPTSALPRGKTIDFLFKSESTFGTPPSGNWTRTFLYSDAPGFDQPLEDDPLLGVTRTNNRDSTQPVAGLIVNDFSLVVPVDFNHFGYWLYPLLGAATVTGASDPFQHVFTSGLEVLPWRSHEKKLASNLFLQDLGVVASTLDLTMARGPGNQRATIGFMGQTQVPVTTTGGGTPAAAVARADCNAAIGSFKVNGVAAANVISVTGKYDNKITPDDFTGNVLRAGFSLDGEATWSGSITLRFVDSTYYALAAAGIVTNGPGTAFSGEMLWSQSASRSLSLLAANMRLKASAPGVESPGRITQMFNWRAEQSAAAAMLVATLKSAVSTYTL